MGWLWLACLVLLVEEEGISWRKKWRRGGFVTSLGLGGVFLLVVCACGSYLDVVML